VSNRRPGLGLILLMIVSVAVFLGMAALGWGGWSALVAHPARAGACVVVVVVSVVGLFSGIDLGRGMRKDRRYHWTVVPAVPVLLALTWLPAYTDRRDVWTIDGDAVRYLGLALFTVGCVLRVGPMFVLGQRFGWPLASQKEHRLVTTGFYRFIRHPSYLGALLSGVGWVLVFRSGIGLILMALLVPLFVSLARAEEALLLSEFGEDYADYQWRTWRLLPFIY
jgi:protein-S-isoprenylcysteine O-methyltransferase Ste14